ncbi:MAG: YHS domain-containing protein [Dehalococcoidia bacterium]|nr:YHS domain-containing protein [Dehalococcoidia bacterium]
MGFISRLFGGTKSRESMGHGHTAVKEQTAKDPVCGMKVNIDSAPAKSEFGGKTYYFCNAGCKKTFDANPEKFTGGQRHEMPGHTGHMM